LNKSVLTTLLFLFLSKLKKQINSLCALRGFLSFTIKGGIIVSYAILRFEKLKSVGSIATTEKHNNRDRETPNADISIENIIVHGDEEKSYTQSFNEITKDIKIRKNAVFGIECFMSASPEAECFKSREKLLDWAKKSVEFLEQSFGESNVIKTHLHLDETTPHLHTFIIPMFEGKLNCKKYLDGREKLRILQTQYHKKVYKFGLERGIKGSKATHMDIKKFYTLVNKTLEKELPEIGFLESSKSYRKKVMEEYQKVYAKCVDYELKINSVEKQLAARKEKETELEIFKGILDKDPELKDYVLSKYIKKSKGEKDKKSVRGKLNELKYERDRQSYKSNKKDVEIDR
jgi:hypothetical protein